MQTGGTPHLLAASQNHFDDAAWLDCSQHHQRESESWTELPFFSGQFCCVAVVFVCMAATVVRLVVVLGLCHAAIALATDAGGWHMAGGDASRSYSGPAGTPPPSINIIFMFH